MKISMALYKKAIEARDEMLDALKKGDRSWDRVTCINIVYEKGDNHLSAAQQCHAGLDNRRNGSFAVVNGLMRPNAASMLNEDEAFLFLDWLLNRSPYASTFITKDAMECIRTKTTISYSDVPANLMAAGQVASRRLWEYAYVARAFADLVKTGVNENLAFYLGHIFSGNFNRSGKCNWSASTAGHCSINPSAFDKKGLVNFLDGKPLNLTTNYSKNTDYGGYDDMFSRKFHSYGGVVDPINKWIHNNFPYVKGGKAEKVNPFPVAARGDDKGCSYEDLIKGMSDFQHKIFEHIGWENK